MADLANAVGNYVKLRDKIKELNDAHKEKMKPFVEMLETLNNQLLEELNTANMDSAKTTAGTVYRTAKNSASLADPDVFMQYVIAQREWDLLDRKANVKAVSDYIEAHGTTPPGVNYSSTFVVGVRRA